MACGCGGDCSSPHPTAQTLTGGGGSPSGSYQPFGSLSPLHSYYQTLKARMCPKCVTFWIVLAVVVLIIYRVRE